MQLSELLGNNSIACHVDAQSKKRALQQLSEIIADKEDECVLFQLQLADGFENLLKGLGRTV